MAYNQLLTRGPHLVPGVVTNPGDFHRNAELRNAAFCAAWPAGANSWLMLDDLINSLINWLVADGWWVSAKFDVFRWIYIQKLLTIILHGPYSLIKFCQWIDELVDSGIFGWPHRLMININSSLGFSQWPTTRKNWKTHNFPQQNPSLTCWLWWFEITKIVKTWQSSNLQPSLQYI